MEMEEAHYLSDTKKDVVIETTLKATQAEYLWEEYPKKDDDEEIIEDIVEEAMETTKTKESVLLFNSLIVCVSNILFSCECTY